MMRMRTLSAALLFALAAPLASASPAAANVAFSETPLTLTVTWSGLIADFDMLNDQLSGLKWWNVGVGNSFSDFIQSASIPIYGATLTAQHHSEDPAHPHAGEQLESWIFNPTLVTVGGATASTGALHPHLLEVSPVITLPGMNMGNLLNTCPAHFDCYSLSLTSASGGMGTMVLQGVHPVPEPETYAMFLAGLGIMGAVASRRKRC